MARVLVLLLKPRANAQAAVAEAKAHVRQQEERDRTGATVEEGTAAKPARIGEADGQLVRLRIKGDNRNRLVLLAVVAEPDYLLVLQCDCDLKRRSLWERDFEQLLKTFRWKQK